MMPETKIQLITNHMKLSINKSGKFKDGNYVVYPNTVITKEGVMNNAYKSAEEVKKFAQIFQNFGFVLPLTVQHPDNGFGFVVSTEGVVGNFGMNTVYNEETTQVTTELRVLKKNKDVIKKIDSGEYPDVSIGYFASVEYTLETNVFHDELFTGEDKEYTEIERNIFPNHNAILGPDEGACSKKDGCGIFADAMTESNSYKIPEGSIVIENADVDELIVKKKAVELEIFNLLKAFEIDTGLSLGYVEVSRGDWLDNESWEEHHSKPIESVALEVYLNKNNGQILINDRGVRFMKDKITNDVSPDQVLTKMPSAGKVCESCGTAWFSGDIACPTCGTKDYYDIELNVPETELQGEADDMVWVRKEFPGTSRADGDITEEVNDLTDGDTAPENDADKDKLLAENAEYKEKLEEAMNKLADIEKTELDALRQKVNETIPEEAKEQFTVDEMTLNELKLLLKYSENVKPLTTVTKLNSMRGSPDSDPDSVSDKDAELLDEIMDNNKTAKE